MKLLSILLLDTESRTRNYYITLGVADAIRRHRGVGRVLLATHADALASAQKERFDLFVALGGAVQHYRLLSRLCDLVRTSVLWTTEDPYESAANSRFAGCFDFIFTNERSSVDHYQGKAQHLPLAATSIFHDREIVRRDAEYRYDLFFVGTAWPNRVATLNRVLSAFPRELKVKLALPANKFLPNPELVRDNIILDWRCGNEDFSRFANQSRVVLTLPRAFSASVAENASGTTPPPRLFEVALAGGAQLVVGSDPEIFDYYDEGREIRTCADDDGVVDAIQAMLDDPAGRIAMAERARARTLKEHLYDHRVDVIIRTAEEHRRRTQTVRTSVVPVSRPRILFVAHNRVGRRPAGGVEFYQEQLAEALTEVDALFLYPSFEEGAWFLRIDEGSESTAIPIPPAHRLLNNSEIEGHFERILVERRIDLVHIHHLLGWPLSLPLIARAYGVPAVAQLHDFFLVCSRYNLMHESGVFCDVVHRGSAQCDDCLLRGEGIGAGSKNRRDGFLARMLPAIDAFVASTPYAADYVKAFYPEIAQSRFEQIEMVDAGGPATADVAATAERPSEGLRIAVLGNVVDHKGARTLLDLVRAMHGQGYTFEILGYIESHLVADFEVQAGEDVRLKGGYRREEVPELLAGCDVSLHLSLWPETYMISLTEAWRAGLVPIVTDLGAPGERVTDGIDGLKVPPGDPAAVRAALVRLRDEPGLLPRLRDAIARKTFPTMADHARRMMDLYRDLIAARPVPHADRADLPAAFNLTTFDVGIRLNHPDWTNPTILWDGAEDEAGDQESAVSEALPPEIAGLPERVLAPSEPTLSWEISDLVIDGQRLPGRVGACTVTASLGLRGWLWQAGTGPSGSLWLRLRSEAGLQRFATTFAERRPELVARLGDPAAEHVGFKAQILVAALPAGTYAIDLLRVLPERIDVAHDVGRFSHADAPSRATLGLWRLGLPVAAKGLRRAEENASVGEHGFDVVEGVAVAREGGVGRFVLTLPPRSSRTAKAALVLEGEAGSVWSEATWLGAEVSRLAVETRIRDIDPGQYRVSVVAYGGEEATLYPTAMRLFGSASSRASLLTPKAPRELSGETPRRVTGRPSIDEVEVEDASSLFAGDMLVRVSGWCFVPNLGRPKRCIATWGEGPERGFFVTESVIRQDVAVHVKADEAVAAGFEIEVPLEAVRSGAVRLLQVYERGLVEHASFVRYVKAEVAARNGWSLLDRMDDAPAASVRRSPWPAWLQVLLARRSRRLRDRVKLIAESGTFDAAWYARQRRPRTEPILDYLLFGATAGADPHPLFDTDWYLQRYPDVAEEGTNPLVHYLRTGAAQGRHTGPLFDAQWCTDHLLGVVRDAEFSLVTYVQHSEALERPTTAFFDEESYRRLAGVQIAKGEAFRHYVEQGLPAGKDPNLFLRHRPRPGAMFPFQHWIAAEGETAGAPAFDPDWYASQYPEFAQDLVSAQAEYRKAGRVAGRLPIDPAPYLRGAKIAVIAHLYYPELWPQIRASLARIPIAYDLYITCPPDRAQAFGELVRAAHPDARIVPASNAGRDIGPFFDAFTVADATADYTAICKIHTKKGVTQPATWRYVLLDSVLGSSTLICDIVRSFLDDPQLGLVGSADLYFSGPRLIGPNSQSLATFTAALHPGRPQSKEWGFFAGTMFWARPALLRPLARLVKETVAFEKGSGGNDGQIAHALERLFGLAAAMGGFDVGLVERVGNGPVPHVVKIHPAPGRPRDERPEVYLGRKAAELQRRGVRI